jgi:Ran GTPase-activating protein (RanGAP) involved in mRNA processing and transport
MKAKTSKWQNLKDLAAQEQLDKDVKNLVNKHMHNHNLKMFDLPRNGFGDKGAKALAELIMSNKSVNHLNIDWNTKVGSVGTRAIIEAVIQNPNFEQLHMRVTTVEPEAAVLAMRSSNISHLDLENTKIGVEGAVLVANELASNRTLKFLGLTANSMGPEGARAFGEALRLNSTLTSANFNGNRFGDEGLIDLAKGLESNCSLLSLGLRKNHFGPNGVAALCKVLLLNRNLEFINIGMNEIGPEGARILCRTLREFSAGRCARKFEYKEQENDIIPSGLMSIICHGCSIGDEGAREIINALEWNNSLIRIDSSNSGISDSLKEHIDKQIDFNALFLKLFSTKDHSKAWEELILASEGSKIWTEKLKRVVKSYSAAMNSPNDHTIIDFSQTAEENSDDSGEAVIFTSKEAKDFVKFLKKSKEVALGKTADKMVELLTKTE